MTAVPDSGDWIPEAVRSILVGSGLVDIPQDRLEGWPNGSAAFEDAYSIVGLWSFPSFKLLEDGWLDAQDRVMDLVASNVAAMDAKAWDGYLVLTEPDRPSAAQATILSDIRRNTRRLRKIVITGEDTRGIDASDDAFDEVRKRLSPLLPLDFEPEEIGAQDPLESLVRRLRVRGVPDADAAAVLAAYRGNRPTVAALHEAIIAADGEVSESST